MLATDLACAGVLSDTRQENNRTHHITGDSVLALQTLAQGGSSFASFCLTAFVLLLSTPGSLFNAFVAVLTDLAPSAWFFWTVFERAFWHMQNLSFSPSAPARNTKEPESSGRPVFPSAFALCVLLLSQLVSLSFPSWTEGRWDVETVSVLCLLEQLQGCSPEQSSLPFFGEPWVRVFVWNLSIVGWKMAVAWGSSLNVEPSPRKCLIWAANLFRHANFWTGRWMNFCALRFSRPRSILQGRNRTRWDLFFGTLRFADWSNRAVHVTWNTLRICNYVRTLITSLQTLLPMKFWGQTAFTSLTFLKILVVCVYQLRNVNVTKHLCCSGKVQRWWLFRFKKTASWDIEGSNIFLQLKNSSPARN